MRSPGLGRALAGAWQPRFRLFGRRDGATTIEYGLIAAIVALGIIAGLDEVEAAIEFLYSYVDDETSGVTDRLAAE